MFDRLFEGQELRRFSQITEPRSMKQKSDQKKGGKLLRPLPRIFTQQRPGAAGLSAKLVHGKLAEPAFDLNSSLRVSMFTKIT